MKAMPWEKPIPSFAVLLVWAVIAGALMFLSLSGWLYAWWHCGLRLYKD